MERFVIRPIGHVENDVEDIGFNDWKALVSRIVIDETYAEALDGIEQFLLAASKPPSRPAMTWLSNPASW